MRENPNGIRATCTIEGFEPREFKLNFESWPVNTAVPISENGRGKVAGGIKLLEALIQAFKDCEISNLAMLVEGTFFCSFIEA